MQQPETGCLIVHTEEVRGSIPRAPTILFSRLHEIKASNADPNFVLDDNGGGKRRIQPLY